MTSLRKLLLLCLMGSCIAVSVSRADPPLTLSADIGPRPLAEALAAFGRQTGLQLIYVSTIAEALQSKGAPAGLTASEALTQLLEGTGLRFEFLNARTIRIFPAPTVTPTALPSSRAPQHSAQQRAAPGILVLEEVTVTARRRAEALNKVPIDMAVWSQEDLEVSGVKGIEELGSLTPSVHFDMTPDIGPGGITYLSIRGISDRNAPTTGLYLDDVPIPPGRGNTYLRSLPFTFDLERVEVLRGPQLQLFGEGNQGGAIRFIFNPPSLSEFTALAEDELATTEHGDPSYEAGAAVGGPLIREVLGFRLSAWRRVDGGFLDRVDPFTGTTVDGDSNHSMSTSVRGALTIAPTDGLRITPSVVYSSYDLHDSPFFFTSLSDISAGKLRNGMLLRQPENDTFYLGSVKIAARLGAMDLTAVSSYFHRSAAILIDGTDTWNWGSPLGAGYPLDYSDALPDRHNNRQATFMQELRLTSADPNATLAWEVGAFYSTESGREGDHTSGAQGVPGLFPAPVNLENTMVSSQGRLAALGELSVKLTKSLTVNAALHTERTHYDAITELPPVLRSAGADSAVLPRFGLSYQADEHELVYLTAAKGYGSGGLWVFFIECLEPLAPIGTDTLWSYELGTKSSLLDGRLQLDTGIFHIVWNNSGQGYPSPTAASCNTGYLGTPGRAESNGFDAAAQALVGAHAKLALALAYTDAHYTHTLIEDGVVVVRNGEAVGYLPHVVSPWNVTASVEYMVPVLHELTAALRAEDIFRSRNPGPFVDDNVGFSDPGNRPPDPSTNLVNLRATLRWASCDAALFINNALDAHPAIMRRNLGIPGSPFVATTFRPRTVGLSARWRF